ncbi:MAG: VWA domain-containing protein [Spirochaetales bacterium]|nr:VWA domain-containing protein [Spirochaetales bacterium]
MAGKKPSVGVAIFIVVVSAVIGIGLLVLTDEEPVPVSATKPKDTEASVLWFQDNSVLQNISLEQDFQKDNYYIVFDGSGSMRERDKLTIAKTALSKFVTFVPPDANLGLAVFDGSGLSERVPLGTDRELFLNAVNKVRADGNTPLDQSMELAFDKLRVQARKQLGYGEYNIVVVTDGEATSGYEPDSIVRKILTSSPVVIHTIGFQIGENHSLNQPGKILYKSANNFDELSQGLESVLAESENFVVTDFKK